MPFLDTPPDTLLGLPKEYAFLLLGLMAGSLIGWWVGRAWGMASAAARTMTEKNDSAAAIRESPPPGISLVVNGSNIDVPAEAMAEIRGLIRARKKLEAVKALREATGLGLTEAKAVMESLEKVVR